MKVGWIIERLNYRQFVHRLRIEPCLLRKNTLCFLTNGSIKNWLIKFTKVWIVWASKHGWIQKEAWKTTSTIVWRSASKTLLSFVVLCKKLNIVKLNQSSQDSEVIFRSPKYQESKNCKKELSYVDDKDVPIVPVMLQRDWKAASWLGLITAGALWVDFRDPDKVETRIESLAKEIVHKAGR